MSYFTKTYKAIIGDLPSELIKTGDGGVKKARFFTPPSPVFISFFAYLILRFFQGAKPAPD